MSIQWMDNFKGYTDQANMLDGTPWISLDGGITDSDPDPNAPVDSIVFKPGSQSGGYTQCSRIALTTTNDKVGIAFRLWLPSLPSSSGVQPWFTFNNAANSQLYGFTVNPNGSVTIRRSGATDFVTTTQPVFLANTWSHVEILVDLSSGDIEFWKDGGTIAQLTVTDGTPPTGPVGIVGWAQNPPGGATLGVGYFIKDVVVYDGAGSVNNTQIGTVEVVRLNPSADVSSGWTPSTGMEDFSLLDKPGGVDDSSYIEAGDPPPAASIVELDDLPADVVSVRALMSLVRAQKSDAGDATLQVGIKSASNDDLGTDRVISTAFTYYWDLSEVDPDTAAAWTPSAVDAAQLQMDRTS